MKPLFNKHLLDKIEDLAKVPADLPSVSAQQWHRIVARSFFALWEKDTGSQPGRQAPLVEFIDEPPLVHILPQSREEHLEDIIRQAYDQRGQVIDENAARNESTEVHGRDKLKTWARLARHLTEVLELPPTGHPGETRKIGDEPKLIFLLAAMFANLSEQVPYPDSHGDMKFDPADREYLVKAFLNAAEATKGLGPDGRLLPGGGGGDGRY
jgi:hypothetical protein